MGNLKVNLVKEEQHGTGSIEGARCIETSGVQTIGCAAQVQYSALLKREHREISNLWVETDLKVDLKKTTWTGSIHRLVAKERGVWRLGAPDRNGTATSIRTDSFHFMDSYKKFCALSATITVNLRLRAFTDPKHQPAAIVWNIYNAWIDGVPQATTPIRIRIGTFPVSTGTKWPGELSYSFSIDEETLEALLNDESNVDDRRVRDAYSGGDAVGPLEPIHCKIVGWTLIPVPFGLPVQFPLIENFDWELLKSQRNHSGGQFPGGNKIFLPPVLGGGRAPSGWSDRGAPTCRQFSSEPTCSKDA